MAVVYAKPNTHDWVKDLQVGMQLGLTMKQLDIADRKAAMDAKVDAARISAMQVDEQVNLAAIKSHEADIRAKNWKHKMRWPNYFMEVSESVSRIGASQASIRASDASAKASGALTGKRVAETTLVKNQNEAVAEAHKEWMNFADFRKQKVEADNKYAIAIAKGQELDNKVKAVENKVSVLTGSAKELDTMYTNTLQSLMFATQNPNPDADLITALVNKAASLKIQASQKRGEAANIPAATSIAGEEPLPDDILNANYMLSIEQGKSSVTNDLNQLLVMYARTRAAASAAAKKSESEAVGEEAQALLDLAKASKVTEGVNQDVVDLVGAQQAARMLNVPGADENRVMKIELGRAFTPGKGKDISEFLVSDKVSLVGAYSEMIRIRESNPNAKFYDNGKLVDLNMFYKKYIEPLEDENQETSKKSSKRKPAPNLPKHVTAKSRGPVMPNIRAF